ncbi:PKD domain-containing protein [Phaeodactylibacter xiamenensis]|uniref:PKD domain-containing protein n=1 Tax=Phaeodactylibacter xiamenensis TaxID=1524460 RepID=UPI003CCB745C
MIKAIKFQHGLLSLFALLFLAGCNNDDDSVAVLPPDSEQAAFTYTPDPEKPNTVTFAAYPEVETWYTHWSFGDNTAAEGMDATKTYPLSGEYEVRFKIFTEGGTAESFQTVSIESDLLGPNLIQNGEFEGSDSWTILPISDGVEVAFENGAASWSGGGWGQQGVYQAIEVEANQVYQINMEVTCNGLSDSWFEVYAGKTVPTPGNDYTDGGIRLGLNTWEGCGGEPFEGLFTAYSCSGEDGTFQFTEGGTVYLVIRGGGADYGTNGVTIDNVSVRGL